MKIDKKSKPKQNVEFENETSDDFNDSMQMPTKWYSEIPDDPNEFPQVTEMQLVELKEEASRFHDVGTNAHNAKKLKFNKSSDSQWMKTVLAKGTTSDKIAAYTVMIQDDPVYNLKTIENLVSMVKAGKKNDSIMVMQTLSELFLSDLLIPNTKLKSFHERPLSQLNELCSGNITSRKNILTLWYYEDQLKQTYTSFIQAVTKIAHDTVEANKEKAVSVLYTLLAEHPEQEKNILTNIVNKLGDPSQKVASKTIYCLNQLLFKHPNMQKVVLQEIERLLFRPNVSHKAQYYAICFLSQYFLTHDDADVAKNLITVYFAFFKSCVKQDNIDSRMMSALLMGVNRAYPYAKLALSEISEHINTMYRVVHQASFNVSLHALNLLFQVCDIGNVVNDRYYCALYKKLIDPHINNTTHQAMLLNLVFKSLRRDTNIDRINIFIKRLLQVVLISSPPLACAILYTISQFCRMEKHKLLITRDLSNDEHIEQTTEKNNLVEESTITIGDEEKCVDASTTSIKEEDVDDKKTVILKNPQYDPLQRNPLYAGGQYCVHDELCLLLDHFHPTVALFTKNLVEGQRVFYSGDPLKDFTLIRFLDRFVFKNPKKIDEQQDDKKRGYHFKFGVRKAYIPIGLRSIPITSQNYLKEAVDHIPKDELFMYTYLQKKMNAKGQVEDNDEEDSDDDSVASDEFEDMLNKMSGIKSQDDDDDEFDFLQDVDETIKTKKNKKTKKKQDDDSGDDDEVLSDTGENMESDDDDDDGDLMNEDSDNSNNENVMDSDEDFLGDLADEDESEIEFGSDEDNQVSHSGKSKKGKKKNDFNSVFASADEFAMMLEKTGASKKKSGSSNSMSNTDKAGEKQISWEEKRNFWISGANKIVGKSKTGKGSNFGKKRKNSQHQKGNKQKKNKNK